jgi:RNA polymerase sigma factor (sigma-70 family)
MANAPLGAVLRHVRALSGAEDLLATTDGQLLERFVAGREEGAFALLLRRHGPMVLGVSRRVLQREQDAEDVFQATFLILARKAGSIRQRDRVGCWLHGVAHRLALKARARAASRRAHERQAATMRTAEAGPRAAWQELQAALDEALLEVPEKHRAALVLCYLEGKSHEEAARQLGCPVGTLGSWVARGRKQLRDRLARRGLALSAAALATALAANGTAAALPAALLRASLRLAAGDGAAGLVSAGAAALAAGGLKTSFASKGKAIGALVLALGLVAGGLGALAPRGLADREPPAQQAEAGQPAAPPGAPADRPRVDRYGDPLPRGAVARLGSLRLYHGRVEQVILSPDGKLAVSVGEGTARLWDATTGRELPLNARFSQAAFFAAAGKLVAATCDKVVALWDVAADRELARVPGEGYG